MRLFFTDVRHGVRALIAQAGFTLARSARSRSALAPTPRSSILRTGCSFVRFPGVTDQNRLATVRFTTGSAGFVTISMPDARDLAAVPAFESTAGSQRWALHVTAGSEAVPARIDGEVVTANYFDVMAQRMTRGRGFVPSEDVEGPDAAVAVISEGGWQNAFGGAADVVGRTLLVNGHPFQFVGVAAPGYHGRSRTSRKDVWVPIAAHARAVPDYSSTVMTNRRAGVFSTLIARLKPNVMVADAVAQADLGYQARAARAPRSCAIVAARSASTSCRPSGAAAHARSCLEMRGAIISVVRVSATVPSLAINRGGPSSVSA
jgi:hypothetical protein